MSNLRKKDFEAIGATIADCRSACLALALDPLTSQSTKLMQINRAFDSTALDLARALRPHNGKFQFPRFMASCGAKSDRD